MNYKLMINNKKESLKKQIYNNTGIQVDIDTLTGIVQRVSKQIFYEVRPSEFLPIEVGDHAFSQNIITYKSYVAGGSFEDGLAAGSSHDARKYRSDVQFEAISVPNIYWYKGYDYNILELGEATRLGRTAPTWNLIESKASAMAKEWQLGIQQVAFLGLESRSDFKGLLTLTNVTSNTSVIDKFISNMTPAELNTFLRQAINAYFLNSNSTSMPDIFVMPYNDFLGLTSPFSPEFPNISKYEYIIKAFRQATGKENFEIKPLVYAQKDRNSSFLGSGSGLNRYVMYKKDPETIRMNIPIPYTTTIQDTINGFSYNSVGYGQFSGVETYREREVLYFDHSVDF